MEMNEVGRTAVEPSGMRCWLSTAIVTRAFLAVMRSTFVTEPIRTPASKTVAPVVSPPASANST